MMQRRRFIHSMAAAPLVAAPLLHAHEKAEKKLFRLGEELAKLSTEQKFWKRVRDCFQMDPEIIHLNCGSIGACPALVTAALCEFSKELEQHPYRNQFGEGLASMVEAVRERAAKFLNANLEELILTRNTTEGVNWIVEGLQLKPGDEILTTNHEHPGAMAGWRHLEKTRGVRLVILEMPRRPSELPGIIRKQVTKRTRAFCFSHVDTITGSILPIQAISKIARQKNAFFLCDGAQATGMIPVDVKALQVDAFVSSSHKWLLAPKGCGLLYLNRKATRQIDSMALSAGHRVYNASVGTRDIARILAHGFAIQFFETIGRSRIEKRIQLLGQRLGRRLEEIPGLTRITSGDSAGIVSFGIDPKLGTSAKVAVSLREDHRIDVKSAQTGAPTAHTEDGNDYNALRFSTHIFNSEQQIDQVASIVAKRLMRS